MTARRVPEKVVQQQIVATLRTVGAKVYVLGHPSPNDGRAHRGTGQTPGLPDLLAYLPNLRARAATRACQEEGAEHDIADQTMALFVEVKAAGGRLRPAQQEFRDRCRHAGIAHVVGGLDAVIAWLVEHGHLRDRQVPHYRLSADRQEAHA